MALTKEAKEKIVKKYVGIKSGHLTPASSEK